MSLVLGSESHEGKHSPSNARVSSGESAPLTCCSQITQLVKLTLVYELPSIHKKQFMGLAVQSFKVKEL